LYLRVSNTFENSSIDVTYPRSFKEVAALVPQGFSHAVDEEANANAGRKGHGEKVQVRVFGRILRVGAELDVAVPDAYVDQKDEEDDLAPLKEPGKTAGNDAPGE
jgi:hypothetical protein